MSWDGSTLNHFMIYQCLLIWYKLTLFPRGLKWLTLIYKFILHGQNGVDYFWLIPPNHQIGSGAARKVSNCVELNVFMFWDGSTLNHFMIYHVDEKYQCLLTRYKLTLFQQKQEQLMDFENGFIVKIYKS